MVQMVGEHVVKHTSNLQGATALSIVRLLMVQLMARDSRHTWQTKDLKCPCNFSVTVRRQELSHPASLGRQRHVQTRYLSLQERVAASHPHSTEG